MYCPAPRRSPWWVTVAIVLALRSTAWERLALATIEVRATSAAGRQHNLPPRDRPTLARRKALSRGQWGPASALVAGARRQTRTGLSRPSNRSLFATPISAGKGLASPETSGTLVEPCSVKGRRKYRLNLDTRSSFVDSRCACLSALPPTSCRVFCSAAFREPIDEDLDLLRRGDVGCAVGDSRSSQKCTCLVRELRL
jgi:hypothetical protein